MKDLKAYIQKNNMKKLVLSAALGMFCYCTNNAMKQPIDINEVLKAILFGYNDIVKTRKAIKDKEGKIYATIKNNEGKVKKGQVLQFITNQFTKKEQNEKGFQDNINKIKKYFHLEDKKNDDECTKDNLTEIFWDEEKKDEAQKINEENDLIRNYFKAIKDDESRISNTFKKYYEAKKTEKGEVEKVEDVVIEEIMNECCKVEEEGVLPANFLIKLRKICEEEESKKLIEDRKDDVLTTIKRRITLTENITKDALRDFIKQKIGIEEKKEGDGCPCCNCQKNCLKKKENPKGDLGRKSEEKKLEGEGGSPRK